MNQFPLLTALYGAIVQLLRYRMALLATLIGMELLPLLVGPYFLYLFNANASQETFAYWLHPWAYSQVVILAFACVAMPGRWHTRVGLALLGVIWIWGAYMTGIPLNYWSVSWYGSAMRTLAGQMVWLFATTAFLASLLVSWFRLELQWEPLFPRAGGPREGQFSLAFLMTAMFAVGLTLPAVRAAMDLPPEWVSPRSILAVSPRQLVHFAVWGLLGSISMQAAVSRRRHWLWLLVLIFVAVVLGFLLDGFGPAVDGDWWMPLAVTIHPFLIATFLPRLGVQLPSIVRIDSLRRALASVR